MRGWRIFPLAMAALLACGGDEEEYPSRDWTGRYATRTLDSSTDCTGVDLPPPLTGFFLELDQHPNNRATLRLNPLVALTGEFEGDNLQAEGRVQADIDLPEQMLERSEADSVDLTTYTLSADFVGVGFEGTYRIRTADIRAIADGEGPVRCTQRYELRGRMLRSLSPDEIEDVRPSPANRPGRRDTIPNGAPSPSGDGPR